MKTGGNCSAIDMPRLDASKTEELLERDVKELEVQFRGGSLFTSVLTLKGGCCGPGCGCCASASTEASLSSSQQQSNNLISALLAALQANPNLLNTVPDTNVAFEDSLLGALADSMSSQMKGEISFTGSY